MTRLTLAVSIAALLLMAAALGWAAHWIWSRPERRAARESERLSATIGHLHAAELAAETARRRADLAEQALEQAKLGAETETAARVAELRAELTAAMEALGDARREAAGWRAAYERAAPPAAEAQNAGA
jgi:hypothetical protein